MRSRKSHQPTLRVLLLALLFGALLPSNAWAIQVKLRINWPLGGSYSVKGLDGLERGELVVRVGLEID